MGLQVYLFFVFVYCCLLTINVYSKYYSFYYYFLLCSTVVIIILKNPSKCSKNTPKSPPKPPQTPPRSPPDRPKSGPRSPQDRPFCIRYVCLPLAIGTNQKRYQNL